MHGRASRRPASLCILVGAAILALGACASDAPRAPTVFHEDRGLGLELDLTAMAPAQRRQELTQAARLGLRWLRLPVRWADLEPRRGQVDWEALDDAITVAESGGLKVLLSIYTAPAWSRHDPPPPVAWWLCDDVAVRTPGAADAAPPTDPRDLSAFLRRVAARYRDRVSAVELWREPNVLPSWRAAGPDPEDYGRLLTAAALTVRSAAPTWRIVSAGLAPVQVAASPVCFQSDLVFLDRLAATGALDLVDAVGVQVPGLRSPALDPPAEATLNYRRAELQHAVLIRQGRADMPLWLLAVGWRAAADGQPSSWGSWLPDAAAEELRAAWGLARGAWPWAGPMILTHPEPGLADDDPRQGYGLWARDGRGTGLTTLGRAVADLTATAPPVAASVHHDWVAPTAPPPWWPAVPGGLAAATGLALVLGWRPRWRDPTARLGRFERPRLARRFAEVLSGVQALLHGWLAAWVALVLVLANAHLPPALAIVCLMALGLVAFVDPLAILTVAAATLPWRDSLRLTLLTRPILPLEGLLLLAATGIAARRLVPTRSPNEGQHTGPESAERRRDLGLVLLLCGWGAVSAAAAQAARPAWFEWRTVIVEPAVFFLLLRAWARPWPALRQVLQGMVGGAGVAALSGLFGLAISLLAAIGASVNAGLATAVAAEGVFRARGPYGSPNNLALWLGRALPLSIAIALDSAAIDHRRRQLRWGAVLVIGLGLLATFSRGSWVLGLPALIGVAVMAWRKRGRRLGLSADHPRSPSPRAPRALMVIAFATVLLLIVPLFGSERLRGTLSLEPGSTAFIRWRLWQSTVEMIRDHPWTGVGPDNFLSAYRDYYVRRDVVQERSLSHPHNLFLDWAARLGLPGLFLGILLIGGTVEALRRAARAAPLGGDRWVWIWGLIGMQAYALAHGLVDNHFFLVDLAAGQWLLLAAARSSYWKAYEDAALPQVTDRRA